MKSSAAVSLALMTVCGMGCGSSQKGNAVSPLGLELGAQRMMAFIAVRDPKAAKAFYRDRLGLKLVGEEPVALVFDSNETILRAQIVESVAPARGTALGWEVQDIAATIRLLKDAGIEFMSVQGFRQDALGVWTANDGTKVAWFRDPDGNVLSVTEFPDRP